MDTDEILDQSVGKRLAEWSSPLTEGSVQTLSPIVLFDGPGYYRVRVIATSTPPFSEPDEDLIVVNTSIATLWIVVDDNGGYLTNGWDPQVAAQGVRYGSYGSFVDTQTTSLQSQTHTRGLSLAANNVFTVTIKYDNNDTGQVVPVPDAFVRTSCVRYNPYPTYATGFIGYTNASGIFTATCPALYYTLQGSVDFLSDGLSNVAGKDGANIGQIFVQGAGNVTFTNKVANDFAVHVFLTLKRGIGRSVAKFARSRSSIRVRVSDNDSNYGINYNDSTDEIRTNFTAVFGEDGQFVTMHEYGHAFHYVAIEPWRTYSCTGNEHLINEVENFSCAFVEGFADFYGAWIAGPELTTFQGGSRLNDLDVETNLWENIGDGSRIEGAVASFFYDLVDGASEPDSPSNSSNGDEAFDNANYAGGNIAQLIGTCQPGSQSRIDGIDEFIYCAERSLTPRTVAISEGGSWWRNYSSVTEGAADLNAAEVRQLWLYNLFGVGP